VPEEPQMPQREALARLAGGVAHEFNNLLTVITGYTCVLLEAHGSGDADHAALTHIQRAAERATELVRQLLAAAGRQTLRPMVVEVNTVVRQLTEVFKRLLGPAIHLHLNLDPTVPAIHADPAALGQVLLDLATNAREAMPKGGQLTLATVAVPADSPEPLPSELPSGPAVRLTVCDTGRGMDEATLTHLFEPFFTSKEVGQGTGLHLAAAYGTIRQCGGHLRVASRPGQGTTFTLTFPAVVGPRATQEATTSSTDAARRRGTILLVDDEPSVRSLSRQLLEKQHFTVLEAADGEEALEVYARHAGRIDLLISDLVMPRLGGVELAQRLAEHEPSLAVLFLSGCNREDADLDQAIAGRKPHFLAKPFRPVELIHAVGIALRERQES
jgi:two-component system, cell cycle sensor histidine kinase and response regulator CckA